MRDTVQLQHCGRRGGRTRGEMPAPTAPPGCCPRACCCGGTCAVHQRTSSGVPSSATSCSFSLSLSCARKATSEPLRYRMNPKPPPLRLHCTYSSPAPPMLAIVLSWGGTVPVKALLSRRLRSAKLVSDVFRQAGGPPRAAPAPSAPCESHAPPQRLECSPSLPTGRCSTR